MADNPIHPSIAEAPASGPGFRVGNRLGVLGIASALEVSVDVTAWKLVFTMPQGSLPAAPAVGKLVVLSRVNATAGVIGLRFPWASVARNENPDNAVLNDEGEVNIDVATAGGANFYQETKLTLDADTLMPGEEVHMDVVVNSATHTIAAEAEFRCFIIWE